MGERCDRCGRPTGRSDLTVGRLLYERDKAHTEGVAEGVAEERRRVAERCAADAARHEEKIARLSDAYERGYERGASVALRCLAHALRGAHETKEGA